MQDLKYGKLPAKDDPRTLSFAKYKDPTAVYNVPRIFGHDALMAEWYMLGNDRYGDCVWAGADHEHMLWNKSAGRDVPPFTENTALADYTAQTGFDPNRPETDQGTVVLDALNYRRHTGVLDLSAQRHKIDAYVSIEPSNWEEILEAAYWFSAVGIGFECPDYTIAQFEAHHPWTVRPGRHAIEGGHYVPVVGRSGGYLHVISWGRVQLMSKAFFHKYCDEAYAILSREYVGLSGLSPEGFNFELLQRDLASL